MSALLIGLSSAAPKQDKKEAAPRNASQSQKDKKGKDKSDKKKAEPKKKGDSKKKEESRKKKVAPAKKTAAPKKEKEAAGGKKADNAKKALVSAEKKKATEAKLVKDSIARLKELAAKKKSAESTRNKAADSLKSAEKNVAVIDGEMKKIAAQLKAKAQNDRKGAEQTKARKIRETEDKERAMVGNMKKELQNLRKTVELLKLKMAAKKECCAECADKAAKK